MAATKHSQNTISIRPGVSILSVLRHLNYRPWYAIAEFVDNSIQSYLDNKAELRRVEGEDYVLRITIEIDQIDGRILIRDNAAGIFEHEYARAFRPAAIPPNRSGLSEFGMGMKSAACWFAKRWRVRTTALGEEVERTVYFDVDSIVQDNLEEIDIQSRPISAHTHFTEIELTDLNQKLPVGRTLGKMKTHLASIYRVFLRTGQLVLTFDGEELEYKEPDILVAPHYDRPTDEPVFWRKEIDFDFGGNLSVRGFAALRETGNVSSAGFALFRRNRVIEGSGDEGYRPEFIFKKSNSYIYQRLFGELHLEGFEVSHTKDGFQWEENEDAFLDLLKEYLDADPVPLLDQAERFRKRAKADELRAAAQQSANRIAYTLEKQAPPVIAERLTTPPESAPAPESLPPAYPTLTREIAFEVEGEKWEIILELSEDPAIGDWISICDHLIKEPTDITSSVQRIGIRMSLLHPFMERFAGSDPAMIEALGRVASALVIAEILARRAGVQMAGTIRREVNKLLRDVLSRP